MERYFNRFIRTDKETEWCTLQCKRFWNEEVEHIIRISDQVVKQEFIFDLPWDMEPTNEIVKFKDEIMWDYMPYDDPEFIYQMNRHRYWICLGQAYAITGNKIYAKTFVEQLQSWILKNPLTEKTKNTTWRSIEAGIRGENWIKAMSYFINSEFVTDDVMKEFVESLIVHAEYLMECNKPFSIKSNWGILENTGLYLIGKALDGYKCSDEYCSMALKRIEKQLKTQVLNDGVQWEQSPMYHNEVLKCCMEIIHIAEKSGEKVPKAIKRITHKMAVINLKWIKPNGCQVAGGDSDETNIRDIITSSAWLFKDESLKAIGYKYLDYESIWNYGEKATIEYEKMNKVNLEEYFSPMPESGHWYLRSGYEENSDFFHFRCGTLGGGHGHFDKLHIDMAINGEDILIDSGRYTYVDSEKRRYFKSALAHNTVRVDEKEYLKCLDSWNVSGLTTEISGKYKKCNKYTYLQGGHLGYQKCGIYVNRRIIAIGTKIYVIVDEFYGNGKHTYEQIFNFNPKGNAKIINKRIEYTGKEAKATLYPIGSDCEITLKEEIVSNCYNQLENGIQACIMKKNEGSTSIITVIVGQEIENFKEYQIKKEQVISPVSNRILEDREAEAISIKSDTESYVVVINHNDIGSDCEYIGALDSYGIGQVMICDKQRMDRELTILQ